VSGSHPKGDLHPENSPAMDRLWMAAKILIAEMENHFHLCYLSRV
jgi:hypothetical protein